MLAWLPTARQWECIAPNSCVGQASKSSEPAGTLWEWWDGWPKSESAYTFPQTGPNYHPTSFSHRCSSTLLSTRPMPTEWNTFLKQVNPQMWWCWSVLFHWLQLIWVLIVFFFDYRDGGDCSTRSVELLVLSFPLTAPLLLSPSYLTPFQLASHLLTKSALQPNTQKYWNSRLLHLEHIVFCFINSFIIISWFYYQIHPWIHKGTVVDVNSGWFPSLHPYSAQFCHYYCQHTIPRFAAPMVITLSPTLLYDHWFLNISPVHSNNVSNEAERVQNNPYTPWSFQS